MKYVMRDFVVLFSLLCLSIVGFSQTKEHELLIEKLENAKTDSVKLEILAKLGNELLHIDSEAAKNYSEKCLSISLKTKNKKWEAHAYRNLGSYYFVKLDYEKSMHFYLDALRLFKIQRDKRMESGVYNSISNINIILGDYEAAKENLNKSINLKIQINATRDLAHSYQILATLYFKEKNYEKSSENFKKAIEISELTKEHLIKITCLNGLAAIQFKNENYTEALKGYNEALRILRRQNGNHQKFISGLYHNIAQTHRKLKNYDEAIEILNQSLDLAKEINSNDDIQKAYSELASCYKEKGDLANALIAQEYYSLYKDSIIDQSTLKIINELQEKYKSEERKKEISELHEQNSQLAFESTLKNSLLTVSVGTLILLGLLVFFYLKHTKTKQQKRSAELENKALRAQMNPHFIFNALNSIQRFYTEGNIEKANDFMGDFAQLMRKVLENSGSTKISVHEELETLKLYMDLEKLRCKDKFAYTISVDESISVFNTQIPPLIIQPFVENAIWHGVLPLTNKEGEINISLKQKSADTLLITISDNGVGLSNAKKSEKHSSKGIELTEQRIGEKISISSEIGKGTIISFTVKTTL